MGTRLELQDVLEALQDGVAVYFQPPTNTQVTYPCIVYSRDYNHSQFADNSPYSMYWRYQVTVIDTDPDSTIPDKVRAMPMSDYSRHFTVANLNHDVFFVYF